MLLTHFNYIFYNFNIQHFFLISKQAYRNWTLTMKFEDKVYALVVKFTKVLFQLLGLFPVFIGEHKSSNHTNVSELLMTCWSFVWIFLITAHISTIIVYREEILNKNPVSRVNDILKISCVFGASVIIIVESLCSAQQFKKIFRKFQRFNFECRSIGVDFEKYRLRSTKAYARIFLLIQSSQILVEVVVWILVKSTESSQWIFFWFANIYPAFLCRVRHIQYIYFLQLIQSNISILQDEVKKIIDNSHIKYLSSSKSVYEATLENLLRIKNAHAILWKITFGVNNW